MQNQKIYMVGIGGIGMSALAQLFAHQGAKVLGSDRAVSATTKLLNEKGVTTYEQHLASQVPEDAAMLVYSDAVPSDNPERVRGRELGIPEMNYFEALGRAAEGKRVLAVAGTHGKTTTTAMIAKMMIDAGLDPTVVVGSIAADLGSNFRAGESDIFVVEACEYRKHFLSFSPEVLVITNVELDHTDFFPTLQSVEGAFVESASNIVPGGVLVTNPHTASIGRIIERAGAHARDYSVESAPTLRIPGEHNQENARAAKAAVKAMAPEVTDTELDASLAAFAGTWRRFEYKGVTAGGAVVYDDYAHHPTAVSKTISAAHEAFPGKKVVVFFHPHLYSRTRDLFTEFVAALATADQAYILPVFAAREAHDETVSHEALVAAVVGAGGRAQAISGIEEATEILRTLGSDTVAFTMGAGDVYKAADQAVG